MTTSFRDSIDSLLLTVQAFARDGAGSQQWLRVSNDLVDLARELEDNYEEHLPTTISEDPRFVALSRVARVLSLMERAPVELPGEVGTLIRDARQYALLGPTRAEESAPEGAAG